MYASCRSIFIKYIYCFHLGTVTACEIRMTDGSLETVTKQINDPSMTSYTADSE